MRFRILKKDFLRKKSVAIILFVFILLASLLVASGSNMIMELSKSLDSLFNQAKTPHFVQIHAGSIDQKKIESWSAKQKEVKKQQTVKMINIEGSNLSLGNPDNPETSSVMDNGFVKQNKAFDFLLNLDNEAIQVKPGEIAVPIYYMEEKNLKIGDEVYIHDKGYEMTFSIVDFVRDSQMNPSIISSKRFVVSEQDFNQLEGKAGNVEYLIEFRLGSLTDVKAFSAAYENSGLPRQGTTVDYSLFKTLNVLTYGIVVAVIMLVSLLLIIIAMICLRFILLSSLEEDYKEVGVMKAIGIPDKHIKKIYLTKYTFIAGAGVVAGYITSLFLNRFFTKNMVLYMGAGTKDISRYIIPLLSVGFIFMITLLFSKVMLRRFKRTTALEALNWGTMGETQVKGRGLSLSKTKKINVSVFLGIKDVFQRFKLFRMLCIIFVICSFIIIVPLNFYHTVQSPEFIKYMGVGKSHMRIDLQQSDIMEDEYKEIMDYIKNDKEIKKYVALETSQFKMINGDGAMENINIETGDFSLFPLSFLEGNSPNKSNEIAISSLNSKELNKKLGDEIKLVIDGKETIMRVSGIYQDVTNGGKTAKASLLPNKENSLRYTISIDLKAKINVVDKVKTYQGLFPFAKVTHLKGYMKQTLGGMIDQLKGVTLLAFGIALFIGALITSLFLKMLVAKDRGQIAIMKSLGLSLAHIRIKYVTSILLVLLIGMIAGVVLSNTLGATLVSLLWSFMGASKITFIIDPLQSYLIFPLILTGVVTITTLLSILSVKKASIIEMISE